MITHVMQPTPKSCGQTVLAMVTGVDVMSIIAEIRDNIGTTGRQLRDWLHAREWTTTSLRRYQPERRCLQLGPLSIIRIRWDKEPDRKLHRSHWALWTTAGVFDPAYNHSCLLSKHPNALTRPSLNFPEDYTGGKVISFMQLGRP